MEKYKRLTIRDLDIAEQFDNIKPENRNKFCLDCFSRLTELEDKIENGTLVDTTNICYEKEEDRDRYIIYELVPRKMIIDFADSKAEAVKKIKELKG